MAGWSHLPMGFVALVLVDLPLPSCSAQLKCKRHSQSAKSKSNIHFSHSETWGSVPPPQTLSVCCLCGLLSVTALDNSNTTQTDYPTS